MTKPTTTRTESMRTRMFRMAMNLHPMFTGTGGKVMFISSDWREVHIRLKLNHRTKNYVGTIFGGSMFSASDPFYMLMVLHVLGPQFVVWDKAASIRYKKPAKKPLYLKCELTDETIELFKTNIAANGKFEFNFELEWKDEEGNVASSLTRTVYAASKEFYKNRKKPENV